MKVKTQLRSRREEEEGGMGASEKSSSIGNGMKKCGKGRNWNILYVEEGQEIKVRSNGTKLRKILKSGKKNENYSQEQ